MTNVDTMFTRSLLRLAKADLKRHFPRIRIVKDAWLWTDGRGCWEFHGPKICNADDPDNVPFFWYGRAHDAYEARYKGWMAWLRAAAAEQGINLDKEDA